MFDLLELIRKFLLFFNDLLNSGSLILVKIITLLNLLLQSNILQLQFFNMVFNTFNVEFELLLNSNVFTHVCFQVTDQFLVHFWALHR